MRRIESETGVSISNSSDSPNQFEFFAPSEASLKEAKELSDVLLREEVRHSEFYFFSR